jgi:UDP-N-acetylglucosamine--N-acetylmuramyl-(pentapeptide) pyrophosphoryl-undecaprenol N-acetylglucosamine transferase
MLVVFAGGGTGGHIYPGIAVARALQRLSTGVEFEFWGSGRALEAEICRKEQVTCRVLPSAPLPKTPVAAFAFVKSLVSGYFAAGRLLKSSGVSAVVGLGGFSSYMPVLVATRRDLPTFLLEQNAVPGKANVHLARRASMVCLTWQASAEHMPADAEWTVTGNPLRRPIIEAAKGFSYDASRGILVLGGSTGARGLNEMVIGAAKEIAAFGRPITHQTGKDDVDRVRSAYKAAGVDADVKAFIDDMPGAYKGAGLVIARAGGTTLSELALFGIPAILVPYPHHKDYHQMANAKVLAETCAAEIVEEREGGSRLLAEAVARLLADRGLLGTMHAASISLGKPDAADEVAAMILARVARG